MPSLFYISPLTIGPNRQPIVKDITKHRNNWSAHEEKKILNVD